MKLLKTILAIGAALFAAYLALKILGWVFSAVFSLLGIVFQLIIVAVIALPIYFVVKKKFLNSGNDKYLP